MPLDMTADMAKPTPALVSVNGVTLQYKTPDHLVTATYQVSFQIDAGDRLVLLGPSGCGKSTLLKSIAGFHAPVEGDIRLKERVITHPGPDRMMVFQEFDQLLPWKTVLHNVAYPMLVNGVAQDDALARARDAISKVNLIKFCDVYPHMLSGGMKQRVAIARAMAMRPDVLLMDEPYAALDALTRRKMQDELLSLWNDTQFTLVFVTHSIEEALVVGSRIVVLSPHPGQVRAEVHCHHLDHTMRETEAFQSLAKRISAMLFDDADIAGGHS
jgi:NitT/TauT family transport system ATP-binding protein